MRKQHAKIEKTVVERVFKYIFAVIYDNNIGSIKRKNLDIMSFESLEKAHLDILKLLDIVLKSMKIMTIINVCIIL